MLEGSAYEVFVVETLILCIGIVLSFIVDFKLYRKEVFELSVINFLNFEEFISFKETISF